MDDEEFLQETGRNILHYYAARPGGESLASMSQEVAGADVNQHCDRDYSDEETGIWYAGTPLHFAIQTGFHDAVLLLLASGAQLSASEAYRNTVPPLLLVPCGGNVETLRHIVSLGCDIVNDTDEKGKTFLHYCTIDGREDTFEAMIRTAVDLGADIHRADSKGNQPLHDIFDVYDSPQWVFDITVLFLELGANVNTAGNKGRTLLHMAVERNWLISVMNFVSAGADIFAHDDAGRTPLAISSAAYTAARSPGAYYTQPKIITALVAAGSRSWNLVPTPCPGLVTALPAVAEAASEELGQLFKRLQGHEQAHIRFILLALHRACPKAPKDLILTILCAALPGIDSLIPRLSLPL